MREPRFALHGGIGSRPAFSRLASCAPAGLVALAALAVLLALVGGPTAGAARSVSARTGQVTPRVPVCKSLYRNLKPCVPISYGNYGTYYPPGKTNPNDALPLDPFSGSVSAPALTMTRCPGFPARTFCTQTFTITIHPGTGAGKVIAASGGGFQFGCVNSCGEHLAAPDGGPPAWCTANAKSLPCTSTTSLPMRIFTDFCGNAACSLPALAPFVLSAGVVVERNLPNQPNAHGRGTFYTQAELSSAAAAPRTPSARTSLAVALSASIPKAGLGVGAPLAVTAKVTASGGAVSSIKLGRGSSSPELKVVSGTNPGPFSLAKGASRSFAFKVKATRAGIATLDVVADGKSASGRAVHGSGSLKFKVGQGPLQVGVAFLDANGTPLALNIGGKSRPDTLRLADDDQGEIPQSVFARVTVKNVSNSTQQNVSINGLPAFSYADPAQARQALPIGIAGPKKSGLIGSLAPGATARVTYGVRVTNNGDFDLSVQVLSSSAGNPHTVVSTGKGTITVLPTAYLWLALHPLTTNLVHAGTSVQVSGTITNRSLTRSIDVNPIEPDATGNAGGGGLVDDTSQPLADGVELPFSGDVAPGQVIDVTGTVSTADVPGTRADLTYAPEGAIVNADNTLTALTKTQVGMSTGSSPIAIHVTTSGTQPPTSANTVFDNFTDGAAQVAGQWAVANLRAGADLLLHPITSGGAFISGIAHFAVGTAQAAADAATLVGSIYFLSVAYESMTPQERGDFANQIVQDFQASHLGADYQALSKAADSVLPAFFDAVSTGNYNQLARFAGQGVAGGLGAAGDALLSDIAFQKLALGVKFAGSAAKGAATGELANAITLAAAIKQAKVTPVLGKGIAGITSGVDLMASNAAALVNDFGLTTKQITELRNYCQRSKIIIAIRSRSKNAAQLIKRGLAIGKNEAIKLKGVNFYDVEYLGYSKHDLNTIVWAEPIPISDVLAKLKANNADAATRKIVLERFALREDEWVDQKIRKVLFDKSGKPNKTIDWGFNGTSNGAPGANRTDTRLLALKSAPNPVKAGGAGRTYERVLVGNKPNLLGHPVPVTQDVDLMALLSPNSSILPPADRTTAYIHLSDILGIEHGETPSFILNGEIMFQKKAGYLADVIPTGEPLAVFAPTGGVTAGFFNPALCIFDTVTLGGRIFFEGGYNDPISKLKTHIQLLLKGMG